MLMSDRKVLPEHRDAIQATRYDAEGLALPANKQISFENIDRCLRTMFAGDLHAKPILSLAGAMLGAIASASLAVGLIGSRGGR
jgi:hypothetical protein